MNNMSKELSKQSPCLVNSLAVACRSQLCPEGLSQYQVNYHRHCSWSNSKQQCIASTGVIIVLMVQVVHMRSPVKARQAPHGIPSHLQPSRPGPAASKHAAAAALPQLPSADTPGADDEPLVCPTACLPCCTVIHCRDAMQ